MKMHPRTIGVLFRYRISLPYHRSLFFTPNASEDAPRTTEACFLYRAHIPYQRRPSPVPNFSNCQKKKSIARTEYDKCQKGRGPFLYGALKMHPVPEEGVFGTEYLSRTGKGSSSNFVLSS